VRILRDDYALRLNEMTHAYEIDGKELDLDHFIAQFRWYCHEHLAIETKQGNRRLQFSADTVLSAVTVVGHERKYHPVREYLTALPPGESGTIERFASDVLHMGEEDHLGRQLLRMWAIGAVRRVFEPGCKLDTILVLEGIKGLRKSSFFGAMAVRREWFGDSRMDIENVKSLEAMHAKWIYEWQELGPFRQYPLPTVQAFLSSSVDNYVRPYGRGAVSRPRSGIIVGSTNNPQFIPEEERRVHPHKVTTVIDVDLAIRDRDLFWAEARDRCLAGEPHSFAVDAPLGVDLRASQAAFVSEHPWAQDVTTWLATRPLEITTRAALKAAGFGDQKPPTRRDDNDMADLLRAQGLCRDAHPSTLQGGGRSRLWRTTSTKNQ
jgi:putative DNA primase/helicase